MKRIKTFATRVLIDVACNIGCSLLLSLCGLAILWLIYGFFQLVGYIASYCFPGSFDKGNLADMGAAVMAAIVVIVGPTIIVCSIAIAIFRWLKKTWAESALTEG